MSTHRLAPLFPPLLALIAGGAPSQEPAPAPAKAPTSTVPIAAGLKFLDAMTLKGPVDFLRGHASSTDAGLVNAVVEIPTGATEKWEVRLDGLMRWDLKNGAPRHVSYLGYPCNYGIVPRTVLGRDIGGDGDPLDILVLGPSLPRGTVVAVKVLGTIRLVDAGEKDDKLVAVVPDSPFAKAASVAELDQAFPGVTAILRIWFENYKGAGVLQCAGFGGSDEAKELIAASCRSFDAAANTPQTAPKNGEPPQKSK